MPMILKNLLGISLEAVAPDPVLIAKLLSATQRNLSDYSGDLVPDAVASDCLTSALALQAHVRAWLEAHRPGMVPS